MKFFTDKLDDMLRHAEKGTLSATAFLNPAEQYEAESWLKRAGAAGYVFWGGYREAERKLLFVFPDWAADTPEEFFGEKLGCVLIRGSGYEKLTHRDYLGALMNCGVDRSCIGDIVPLPGEGDRTETGAVVFLTSAAAGLLTGPENPLERVGRDTVKITPYAPPEDFDGGKRLEEIEGVIASARLDCAAAFFSHTSREKAKAEIAAGNVQLNYSVTQNCDAPISEGDIISVRGVGRFVIYDTDSRTRRDRVRLRAGRYV